MSSSRAHTSKTEQRLDAAGPGRKAKREEPASASVLSLQRSAGNRAVARLLTAGRVIQRDWYCADCDETTVRGKRKKDCPKCGNPDVTEVKKKAAFGTWWESLDGSEKQRLLRQHGSHEAHGGAQMKRKGGGGKGDQHDTGTATAMKAIREEYERGDYD
jgi:hypothetical protein